MTDVLSPIVDDESYGQFGRWTLAGCSSLGIIYAISIDTTSLKATLWNYNNIQRMWKILVVSDFPSRPRLVEDQYLLSAIYDEERGRVDVFIESDTTSYILRFIAIQTPKLERVFSAVNDENIQFDGERGPSLHYIGEHLIVTGSKRDDFQEIFRIFQVAINEGSKTFTLLPVWCSDRSTVYRSNQVVAFGKKLLMVANYSKLLCFTPNLGDGITQWPEPTMSTWTSGPVYVCALCASASSPDTFWIISPLRTITGAQIVAADGHLREFRVLGGHSLDRGWVYENAITGKYAAASSTHLFWIRNGVPGIASAQFSVPSLEYLCLSKLCSTTEEYRKCKSEKEAVQLGIPSLAWSRYCQ